MQSLMTLTVDVPADHPIVALPKLLGISPDHPKREWIAMLLRVRGLMRSRGQLDHDESAEKYERLANDYPIDHVDAAKVSARLQVEKLLIYGSDPLRLSDKGIAYLATFGA